MGRRMVSLLAVVATTVALAAGVALAKEVTGTTGPDVLEGTMNADMIKALTGDDEVYAKDGIDDLRGGSGNDKLFGEHGDDTYYGGNGEDLLSENSGRTPYPPSGEGYAGKDVMYGGEGTDYLVGARNADTLYGGPNTPETFPAEELYGDAGNDTLYGGDGFDELEGEQGSDRFFGNKGDDFIDAADDETVGTPDEVDCGPGTDAAIANENDTVKNCEYVIREANPSPTATAAVAASGEEGSRGNR